MTGLVSCPLCGQYEGRPESVRAHISAKRDETHSGESGFDYDEVLGISDDPETEQDGAQQSFSSASAEVNQVNSANPDDGKGRTSVPTVQSVEQDRDDDGNELVRLTLYGAGAYALAKLLAGDQDQTQNRGRM